MEKTNQAEIDRALVACLRILAARGRELRKERERRERELQATANHNIPGGSGARVEEIPGNSEPSD